MEDGNKDNTLNVRIPPKLKEEMEEFVEKTKKYLSVSDFVRQAIRTQLEKEKAALASEGGT